MTREEAIQVLKNTAWLGSNEDREATEEAIDMAIEALSAPQTDLISRADAIEAVEYNSFGMGSRASVKAIKALPSADAVQGEWRTGKPTEQGEYMVTLDAWGHRYINIMYYAEPQMPNREVDGICWYRSDDEWGDVVYDDADILAWMPLPKPYREDGEA